MYINLLLYLFIVSFVSSKKINLFLRDLDDDTIDPIGFINYPSVYLTDHKLNFDKSYCIGTKDLHNHDCFAYVTDRITLNNSVFEIMNDERISMSFGVNEEPRVEQCNMSLSPQPNMDVQSIQKEKIVISEKEDKEEEDEKSWIQKNWLYIVPPLILFLIFSGDSPQQ